MVDVKGSFSPDHPEEIHRYTQSFPGESHHRGAGCEVGFVVRHTDMPNREKLQGSFGLLHVRVYLAKAGAQRDTYLQPTS